MLHFCVILGIPLLCLVIYCSNGDKVTNDVSGQIALPTSNNPVAVVADLSEGWLYKLDVMCISFAWTRFNRMKLLATCYLVNCLEWWDQIIHKLLIILDQCLFPGSFCVCLHHTFRFEWKLNIFRFLLRTEQEMEKTTVPLFS